MGIGRRYLVWDAAGRFTELARRDLDRAESGAAPLSGFAGRCVHLVSIILVYEKGGVPRIWDLDFSRLYFDDDGFVDGGKRDRMIRLMLESCADQSTRAAPLAARLGTGFEGSGVEVDRDRLIDLAGLARRRLAAEFGWEPSPDVLDAVLARFGLPLADGVDRRLKALRRMPPVLSHASPHTLH